MTSEKQPLIVVKRCYYDEFRSGQKLIEYRRHKGQFNANVYRPGRKVRIAFNYNLTRYPWLAAEVRQTEILPASSHPETMADYNLEPDDEIALIHLTVDRREQRRPGAAG